MSANEADFGSLPPYIPIPRPLFHYPLCLALPSVRGRSPLDDGKKGYELKSKIVERE